MEFYGVKIDTATMTNEEMDNARHKARALSSRADLGVLCGDAVDISRVLDRQLLLRKLYAHKHSS